MFNNNSFGNTSFGGTTFGATNSGFNTGFGANTTIGAFGTTQQQPTQPGPTVGTTIRFVPLTGTDTVAKPGTSGGTQQITTRHQNISAMKEYETKSVDELRLEDYMANRKHGQPQSAFGATPFGSMQPSTSQQSTSVFGTQPTQPISNIFSTPPQNQATNIFGQPKNDFGINNSTNLFNSTMNKPATTVANSPFNIGNQFNSTASTSGAQSSFPLFNNNSQTNTTPFGTSTINSPFKTNQTTSLFGSTTNTQPASQPFGFPSTSTQQTSSLFNNSITSGANKSAFSMPQTGNSSFSFGTSSAANTLALNTSTTSAAPLFGTNTTSTTSNTGLFGSNLNSSIGFNQPSSNTNTSLFGGGTNQQTGVTNNLFSSPAQNQATNIFGQPKNDFGMNNSSNLFNSNMNKPATTVANSPFNIGNQFNNTSSNSVGQSSFPLFNNNSQTNATPFGTSTINSPFKTNQTTSLFGSTNNTQPTSQPFGFSTTNTLQNSSLFNNSLGANKSAFSLPQTGNSSFSFGTSSTGNTLGLNTNTTTVAPLFGTNTTSTTSNSGLFGTNLNSNLSFGQTNMNTNSNTSIFGGLTQQTGATNNLLSSPSQNQNNSMLKNLPYGVTSFLLNQSASSSSGLGSLKLSSYSKTVNQYKMNAKTNVKLDKPATVEKPRNNTVLFDGLDDNTQDDMRCAIDVFVPRRNIKKLDIGTPSHLSEGDADRSRESTLFERNDSIRDTIESTPIQTRHVRYSDNTVPGLGEHNRSSSRNQTLSSTTGSDLFLKGLDRSGQLHDISEVTNNSRNNLYRCGFVNSRSEYIVKPSLDEMEMRYNREDDTCFVDSLLIERPDYGSILFEHRINVKGINIDDIVHIRRKEVIVYPDDENKPPVGRDLNRPAIITLHQVWPIDRATNEVIKDVNVLKQRKYAEKIESATIEKGARFIEYRPETGTWMFAVKHFSKYGITDDDEEFTAPIPPQTHQSAQVTQAPLQQLNQTTENIPVQCQPTSKPPLTKNHSIPTKTSIKLDSSYNLCDKSRNESLMFDSMDDSSYSIKDAIEEFFTDEDALEALNGSRRSLSIHGTKRRALQQISPKSTYDFDKLLVPKVTTVPQQQKVREMKLKADLYSARNKLTRDIMSVCVAGSPKVRFFNGSRKMCIIQADEVMIYELKLVETEKNGSLPLDNIHKFDTFLEKNSTIKTLNTKPVLAPYIETNDFIPEASSHDLLYALYGNLSAKTPYSKQNERLDRVINWLAAVNCTLPEPSGLYQMILYHMSCDRYDLAAEIAIENDHPRLALLVATFNIDKTIVTDQLTSWRLSNADQYIDHDLLKIYIILSGQTEWKQSNDVTIRCLTGLHWTQQLCLMALHFPPFITEPERYYGFHMLPLHIRRLDTDTNDVDYHILARHSPANILSASQSMLEEWFLAESLKSFHVINSEAECMQTDMIHCNLAAQLGPIDLRWACFIALHIFNNEVRNQVLISCLEQNYNQLTEIKHDPDKPVSTCVEKWLIEKLKIPVEFIENSKSLAKKT